MLSQSCIFSHFNFVSVCSIECFIHYLKKINMLLQVIESFRDSNVTAHEADYC